MELTDVRVEPSPEKGRVRLIGTVLYESGAAPEDYWIDLPARYGEQLSTTGNCWLAILLPLAVTLGEPIRIPLPVDRVLLTNTDRLMRIWKSWYSGLSIVGVEADVGEPIVPGAERTGAFFSGGADSFFTLLRRRDTARPGERRVIQDLITLHGFDLPLAKRTEFDRMRARHERVADALGVELIDVATNLRLTRWSRATWGFLAHGAGLAGIGLALERRLGTVYIAGGGGYRGLHPWGSHSVTDPLFSTASTAILYDGVEYLRTEKIEAIADFAVVHDALHVCYAMDSDVNCGVCNKCVRTMLVLDLCGTLGQYKTFPPGPLLERVARMDCSFFADRRELEDIRAFAVERGRLDAVRAIDRAVSRTELLQVLRKPVNFARGLARQLLGRGRLE